MTSVKFFFISLFFLSAAAQARITDDQVNFKVNESKIEITTKPGFHLNAEAPSQASFDDLKIIVKPEPKTESLFSFKIPGKAKIAKISFYVCDDKKTACEQHLKELNLTSGAVVSAAQIEEAKDQKPAAVEAAAPSAAVAVTDAKVKKAKPTLFIFSAPWCPACIRMQTEIYPQKNMQAAFKKVDVKKINIDLPENLELSEKYHVKAIPTYILVNTKNQEVMRWLDFQPATAFANQLNEHIKNMVTFDDLEKKAALGDPAAISALGMNAYNSMDFEQAIKWLSQSKKIADLNYRLAAEVSLAEDKDLTVEQNHNEYINVLQKAMTMTLSQLDQYRWTAEWIDKLKERNTINEETTNRAKVLIANITSLLKDEERMNEDFAESTIGDVGQYAKEELLLMKARLYGVLNQTKEKADTYKTMVDAIRKKNLSPEKPGEVLLAIAYLREAGEKDYVAKLYKQLIATYPETYVYHEKYSRYLQKEKNYDLALSEVDTALKFAEGNEPQLYLLKARILSEMNNKKTAISVLDQAMGLEKISHPRYKKTVAQIEQFKKDLVK